MERREAEDIKVRGKAAIDMISQQPPREHGRLKAKLHFAITGKHGGRFDTFDDATNAWCDRVEELYRQANGEGSENRRFAETQMEGIVMVLEGIAQNPHFLEPVAVR